MKRSLFVVVLTLMTVAMLSETYGQQQPQYISSIVGFYNLENLFDTIDNPTINDEEFLPASPKKYNTAQYRKKLDNMAKVIASIGTDANPDGLALLGVVEIENDTVLMDLLSNEALVKRGYKYVQYQSPDERGIDVGLIYSPKYFTVLESFPQHVALPDKYATRDILVVKGDLVGEQVYVLVNHWPSRRGRSNLGDLSNKESMMNRNLSYRERQNAVSLRNNEGLQISGEEMSRPNRIAAAKVCRSIADSILQINPQAKIIIMGDLNDDPSDISAGKSLSAKADMEKVKENDLYNPYANILKQGYGTLAYNGKWNLFDQIMYSHSWLDQKQTNGWFLYKAHIFFRDYLVENEGKFKGYPKRSWNGDEWNDGYSDHLPVYTIIVRQLNQ